MNETTDEEQEREAWLMEERRYETARDILIAIAGRRDLTRYDEEDAVATANILLAKLAKVEP